MKSLLRLNVLVVRSQEENENLKLHLAAKEEMLLNDLVNEISQKRAQLMAADDSYAQLNIKRPRLDQFNFFYLFYFCLGCVI